MTTHLHLSNNQFSEEEPESYQTIVNEKTEETHEFNCVQTIFNAIDANQLFSIFTADIIKEDVAFKR